MALSKQRRQRIKKRAVVEAHRENASALGAARGSIRQANRDYRRDVQEARGAQRVLTSQLSHMLSNIKGSGLRGKYAAQTAADLRSRKAEAFSGLPYAVSQAQARRADALSDARAAMADAQVQMQSSIGKRTTELLESARKEKADRLEDRADSRKEQAKMNRGVQNALVMAKALWTQADGQGDNPSKSSLIQNPDMFAAQVAKVTKGADAKDSRKAAAIVIRQYQRQALRRTFSPWLGQPKRKRR